MIHITQAEHDAFKAAVAERDRLLAMTTWQPIAAAPMDGTKVDLWMVNEKGKEWREANAYYTREGKRSGWMAPGHYYEGEDGWCDHPRTQYEGRIVFTTATHYMLLPAPPTIEGGREGAAP